VAALLIAGPSAAAPYLRIDYTVTGGNFYTSVGTPLSGAITGGAVSIRLQDGVTALPAGNNWVTTGAQITKLTLSNTGGTFRFLSPLPTANINASAYQTTFGQYYQFRGHQVASPGNAQSGTVVNTGISFAFLDAQCSGFGFCGLTQLFTRGAVLVGSFGANHNFTLGNEIQTVVPEPSTGLLGLGLFGGIGGAAGLAARARARRRS
jgi:hypothetical protein